MLRRDQLAKQSFHDRLADVYSRGRSVRERVYLLIRSKGRAGATDKEISDTLGIPENTTRPRRVELVADGLVKPLYQTDPIKWVVS